MTPTPPGVGGHQISFGTTSAPKSSTATTSSSPSTTSGTAPSTPTATLRPGKPTPTPASHHAASPAHHAASPAHHAAARASSGGASLAPSTTAVLFDPASNAEPGLVDLDRDGHGLSSTPPGFPAPKSWTGTVAANPALTGAVTKLSGLLSNGNRPPSFLIPIYMEAGRRYNVPWEVLAAINAIESDYGRNLNTSSAGAVGWMQFEPSTWSAVRGGRRRPQRPQPVRPARCDLLGRPLPGRRRRRAGRRPGRSLPTTTPPGTSTRCCHVPRRSPPTSSTSGQRVEHGKFSVYFATGRRRPADRSATAAACCLITTG